MTNTDSRPQILLAHHPSLDVFDDDHLRRLAEIGTVLNTEPISDWNASHVGPLLERCTVVCGHWGCPTIDADVLAAAPNLGLVAYAAGTVKGVVDAAVWDRGVRVTSGAVGNAEPVAQFTLAAIIFAGKQVLARSNSADARATFAAMSLASPVGNYDKTIGLVGASLVGRRVIELLRSFDHMDVIVYDPFLDDADAAALGVRSVELDQLCAESDIVSIHAPELPATYRMIGADQFASMRDGCTVINTARGSLIDHDAFAPHVRSGRLSAFLDVTDPEPLPADHEFRSLPSVFLTPHLAGSQGSELARLANDAIDEIERWAAHKPPANEVTKEQLDRTA